MEFYGFEIIDSLPALYSQELDLVVISDLHLGLEGNVTSEGGYVPKFQLDDLREDIKKIVEETNASKIIVNGDLKHEFARTHFTEKQEVEDFLDLLSEKFEEIIIIQGNHDTFIDQLTKTRNVELKDHHIEGNVLFFHGHKKLPKTEEEYDTVVIGHEHPALVLKDEIGVKEKVDTFLYGETEVGNLIVTPAFSKISGGSKVNQIPQYELLSPILKDIDFKSLKAVAVSREAGVFEFPELDKIH